MLDAFQGKTILVTGATGFIGSHLTDRLKQVRDVRLVLLTRQTNPAKLDSTTWVQSDCQSLSPKTWSSRGITRFDYVFHLAAETPKVAAVPGTTDSYNTNLTGTVALLESLPEPPKRFVFASTLDVYAPVTSNESINEASPIGPKGPYGISKVACEEAVANYSQSHGLDCVTLRYGHIYGPGEGAYLKLIPQAIRQFLQGQSPDVYGDGSAERDYLYVADLVEASLRAAICDPTSRPINLVRGQSVPIRSIVETLAKLTNFAGTIRYLADKPSGNSLRFDNQRMRELLGEWTATPLEIGLQREVEYFRTLS